MFVVPPPPANEAERLDFLLSCGILDTPQDERFDRLTRIASRVYGADVAFLSFVDDRLPVDEGDHGRRHWFVDRARAVRVPDHDRLRRASGLR